MGEETLRKVVEGLFATDLVREEITFVWHAGEPLAVPREWYGKAFEIISRHAPAGVSPNKSPYQLELRVCPKNPAANQFPDVFRASLATRHRQKPIFPIRQGAGGRF